MTDGAGPRVARLLDRRAAMVARRIEALRSGTRDDVPAPVPVPLRLPAPSARPAPPPKPAPPRLPPAPSPEAEDPLARLTALRRAVDLDSEPLAPVVETQAARLSAILPGMAERTTEHGPCCVVERTYDVDARHGDRGLSDVLDRTVGAGIITGEPGFERFLGGRALYLDLETTGLAHSMGTLAFVIGTAHFRGSQLVFEQWLLRDPDEEPATLVDFARRCKEADWLVTFNGRSFDLPLLRTRFAANRIDDPTDHLAGHLDLLHASRRLLGHDLHNCRLCTLEQTRLGVRRIDDVPGSEAPTRYHAYLHGEDPTPLLDIVAHNRDDVLSMVTLLDLLLERRDRAEANAWSDPECALALARHATALGEWAYAERVYTAIAEVPQSAGEGARGLERLARRRKKAARPGSPG